MAIQVGAVVLKVRDMERASRFWQRALGYQPHPGNAAFLQPVAGSGPELHLDEEDETHLDLWALATEDVNGEVERLLAIGAERADWQYSADADSVVLRDTEGNLFCVVDTSGSR